VFCQVCRRAAATHDLLGPATVVRLHGLYKTKAYTAAHCACSQLGFHNNQSVRTHFAYK